MPKHNEKRRLPYTADQLFTLVADVASYPDFLPWVISATVYNQTDAGFDADLAVGTHGMSQMYSSRVTVDHANRVIEAVHTKGPFSRLTNRWSFTPEVIGNGTDIEFFIDFEIDNMLLRAVLQPFLTKAMDVMVEAFEKRAAQLYG